MDAFFTRLEEASHAGDVNLLKELLNQDKLLLEKVIMRTSERDNPLHIAAMLGHAHFVREVIHHKPELAEELNDQGFSPLHLAAAHGHATVVKELLKAGLELCLLSEKQEGLLPLHIAVKKRRTGIVKELVEACKEAAHRLRNGGETILHLAVKYNSFDTVEFLIDRVQDPNSRDDRGNIILHHAVASKQLSVIKLLLSKAATDVNSMNSVSLTPLDVLLESRLQNGDLILGEIIRAAGGKTAAELGHGIRNSVSRTSSPWQPHCIGNVNDIEEATIELRKVKREKNYNPQILLLVATLVATVTFQAALNPPGGFKPDDKDHERTKGQPVFGYFLNYFLFYDVIALFLSVSVMMLLLCVVPRKKNIVVKFLVGVIWCAAFSMALAFTAGISLLYGHDNDNPNNEKWFMTARDLLGLWQSLRIIGISWMLVRVLIFLLKKTVLWELVLRHFALLKRGCFLKWQQFSIITKINWSNCWQLFKNVICIVLILGVLAAISYEWVQYFQTMIFLAKV